MCWIMPPRVGFKKSRQGCLRCKVRKVKCDERRPVCGWCAEHSQHCEYPPARTKTGGHSIDSLSILHENSAQRRLLELGLFHYYVFTVAPSFPFVNRDYGFKLHGEAIPQQALRCDSLLDALYAYALLHLHVQTSNLGVVPDNADFFEDFGLYVRSGEQSGDNRQSSPVASIPPFTLHQHYLDKAVTEQQQAIQDINSRNADGMCLTSILIGMMILVHSAQEMATDPEARYTIPLQWFYLFRSFSACLRAASPILSPNSATKKLVHAYPRSEREVLLSASSTAFKHLIDWHPHPQTEIMDTETHEAYDTAFRCIENIHNYIVNGEPWEALGRYILAFPGLVPDLFVTFLEEKRPRALVMLAHLLAMSKKLDQKWWIFRGVADTHVREISLMVPDEWQWAMIWPLRVVAQENEGSVDVEV